jgi:hypothetical protein
MDSDYSELFKKYSNEGPNVDKLLKLVPNNPHLPKIEGFSPIENEEGLFYRMRVEGDDYKWEVFDDEIKGCKMIANAKTHSLNQVIDRFKREFLHGK